MNYLFDKVIKFCIPILVFVSVILFSGCTDIKEVAYGTGDWDADSLGNHRAVIKLTKNTDAAWIHIPWRRRDLKPEDKNIIIVDATSGERVNNFLRVEVNREFADIIFQPKTTPGNYFIYYMQQITSGSRNYPTVTYTKPEDNAEKFWLNNISYKDLPEDLSEKFPQAQIVEIQSIDEFNSFYPMEVIASSAEIEAIIEDFSGESYILFPEDRKNPIRMTEDLPYKWIKEGSKDYFQGEACRGEFYAFQIGLYNIKETIEDVEVIFTNLETNNGKNVIPDSALNCYNTGGVNWTGVELNKICRIEKDKIQALWMGVQVPEDIKPGKYQADITIHPAGLKEKTVKLILKVNNKILKDGGDSEPWRHSRLSWLDSKIAFDDGIVPPYTPVNVIENTISCLGRSIKINNSGFPESIVSFFAPEVTFLKKEGREMLGSPISLIIDKNGKSIPSWEGGGYEITKETEGTVVWKAESKTGIFSMKCRGQMEFDGNIEFKVEISVKENVNVDDIRLEIPLVRDVIKYMMGMGYKGGYAPDNFSWKWAVENNQDALWVGDVNAGLQCSFKDENYARPLNTNFYLSKPLNMPPSWYNNGSGGLILKGSGNKVLISCYSGPRTINVGEVLHFNFRLLLTPFKLLDTDSQWNTRFYHSFKTVDEIAATGANTINVHHANDINPFINYPFLRPEKMKQYIDEAHEKGLKVKIYYTVRELSNKAPEIFALRSLGDEILSYGPGGGFSWLQEHIGSDYIAAWFVPPLKDAAIINSGVSRWHNYYIEGLNWLVKNVGIDGLYIDDVAFDRTTMKRVRKILDRGNPGALIDLHSANQFNVRDGYANSANLYLEHFPYINRLWFGEYFDYDYPPEFWLLEVSGIPFGLMGEMLQGGGNPWRGMIFGMTSRLPWAGDPSQLWKVWDDFGMTGSRMVGYWSPNCPVKTGNKDILATAYLNNGKALISIASWAKENVNIRLQLDWDILDLDPHNIQIIAPEIKDFQTQVNFSPGDIIPVEKGKGWLLLIENK